MNIFAGLRLYGMKPRQPPHRAASMTATLLFASETSMETTSIDSEAIADTPQARPSSPSIRLTEFVTPTIQSIVTGTARMPTVMACSPVMSRGFETTFMMTPDSTAMTAATICTQNFSHALRFITSSMAPTTTMSIAPSRMPRTCGVMLAKSRTESRKPRKMASPPMRGIGWLWICLFLSGTSIAPTCFAKERTTGVATKDITKATARANIMFFQTATLKSTIFISPG